MVGPMTQMAAAVEAAPWEGHRIVPLATLHSAEETDAAAAGLSTGGLPIIEVALRSDYGMEALRRLASRDDLTAGAGTVLSVEQADQVIDAGAAFAVTPGLDPDVVERLLAAGVPVLPGVLTPSEVQAARRLGLDQLKLFPADAVDAPALLNAYRSVQPTVGFMPSGGVGPDNLQTFLEHPSVFAVSGSWMLKDLSGGGREVAARAAQARALVEEVCS